MPRPKRQPRMVKVERLEGFDESIASAWGQLKTALEEAITSGALAQKAGPDHVAVLQAVLKDDEVGHMVFQAGFFAALTTLNETFKLAVSMPHDCGDPTHATASSKIGRA